MKLHNKDFTNFINTVMDEAVSNSNKNQIFDVISWRIGVENARDLMQESLDTYVGGKLTTDEYGNEYWSTRYEIEELDEHDQFVACAFKHAVNVLDELLKKQKEYTAFLQNNKFKVPRPTQKVDIFALNARKNLNEE